MAALADDFARAVGGGRVSMAAATGHLLRHRRSARAAVAALPAWLAALAQPAPADARGAEAAAGELGAEVHELGAEVQELGAEVHGPDGPGHRWEAAAAQGGGGAWRAGGGPPASPGCGEARGAATDMKPHDVAIVSTRGAAGGLEDIPGGGKGELRRRAPWGGGGGGGVAIETA